MRATTNEIEIAHLSAAITTHIFKNPKFHPSHRGHTRHEPTINTYGCNCLQKNWVAVNKIIYYFTVTEKPHKIILNYTVVADDGVWECPRYIYIYETLVLYMSLNTRHTNVHVLHSQLCVHIHLGFLLNCLRCNVHPRTLPRWLFACKSLFFYIRDGK